MTFRRVEMVALPLERGSTGQLACLPPHPTDFLGDRGALERQLDRGRKVSICVGLLCEKPKCLTLAGPQAEPARFMEGVLE